jgi:hypothetical protein
MSLWSLGLRGELLSTGFSLFVVVRDINALNRLNNKGIDNLQLKKQPQDSRTTTNKEKPVDNNSPRKPSDQRDIIVYFRF